MERQSFEQTAPVERGPQIEKVGIEPGQYSAGFGFRGFRENDKRFFYAGNDTLEDKKKPFHIDTNSPEFQNLEQGLRAELTKATDLHSILRLTDEFVQQRVASNMDGGVVHSLSDIIRLGRGVCTGKSVLAGNLLQQAIPALDIKEVTGVVGAFRPNAEYPFLHSWLRVAHGREVGLVDLMYHRVASYTFLQDGEIEERGGSFDFSKYSVDVESLFSLRHEIGVEAVGGCGVVRVPGAQEMWLIKEPEDSLNSQIVGATEITIQAKGGSYSTLGKQYLRAGDPNGTGPILAYPLEINKLQ